MLTGTIAQHNIMSRRRIDRAALLSSRAVIRKAIHFKVVELLKINIQQFVGLAAQLDEMLPFIEHFTIEEYRHPADEVSSFLITLKRAEIDSDLKAFILLLERLEYHEEEWNWNEKIVRSCRDTVLGKIFKYISKNGVFINIDSQTITKKISEIDIDIDVYKEITTESCNIIIFDEWNLLQLAGKNADNYYLFVWFTTA